MIETREVVPSQVINDRDHGALVVMAAAFCLVCTLLIYGIRMIVRWPWRSLFGRDDVVTTLAVILSIVQIGVISSAIPHGLGKVMADVSPESAVIAKKYIYTSDLIFVITNFTSKLAVLLLFERLASTTILQTWARATEAVCGIFGLASLLTIAIQNAPWSHQAAAGSELSRWIAVAVLSGILDLTIIVLPICLVSGLQTRFSVKMIVVVGFALRIPLIVISILRIVSISVSFRSREFLLEYTITEIYTQVEMMYGIVSATVPCLRIFLRFAFTDTLAPTVGDYGLKTTSKGNSSANKSGSNPLSSARRQMRSTREDLMSAEDTLELADMRLGRTSAKASAASDKGSMASDESHTAIMVRQTVDVRFE